VRQLSPGTVLVAAGWGACRTRAFAAVSAERIEPGVYELDGGLFREHRTGRSVTVRRISGGYLLHASGDVLVAPGSRFRLVQRGNATGQTGDRSGRHEAHGREAVRDLHGAQRGYDLVVCLPFEVPKRERERGADILRRFLQAPSERASLFRSLIALYGWAEVPDSLLPEITRDAGRATAGGTAADGDRGGSGREATLSLTPFVRNGRTFLCSAPFVRRTMADLARRSSPAGKVDTAHFAEAHGLPVDLLEAMAKGLAAGRATPNGVPHTERPRSEEAEISAPRASSATRTASTAPPRATHRATTATPPAPDTSPADREVRSPRELGMLSRMPDLPESDQSFDVGASLVQPANRREREALEVLESGGAVVRVGQRYCRARVFDAVVRRLERGSAQGDAMTLGELKRRTGVPRSMILEFADAFTAAGVLRRDGDLRTFVGERRGE
jgi:hypothetical protein